MFSIMAEISYSLKMANICLFKKMPKFRVLTSYIKIKLLFYAVSYIYSLLFHKQSKYFHL